MNPKVVINLKKLESNFRFLADKLKVHDLSITAVTKVHNADQEIVALFEKFPEIEYFGDSRIKNLMTYQHSKKKKILIRVPMPSEVEAVIEYSDISFNSEVSTIKLLNEEAKQANKIHRVLLMVDLGDLREGFFEEADLMTAIRTIIEMDNIELIGLGVNLTCYGAILPDEENLGKLVTYCEKIKEAFNLELPMVSGGNSSSLYLLDHESFSLPSGITNLRIGETFYLGGETSFGKKYPEMFDDAIIIHAEIVELKEKPSVPVGISGVDAFGQKPTFVEKGKRLKGILALGRQDIVVSGLIPVDEGLEILGASSDHLIIDFTESNKSYVVGDTVEFRLQYGALLAAFTSKYVTREYVAGGNDHDIPSGNMD